MRRSAALLSALLLPALASTAQAADPAAPPAVGGRSLAGPSGPTAEDAWTSALGVTTLSYPDRRDSTFLTVRLEGVRSDVEGAVGVDLTFRDEAVNGGASYLPCKNPDDPFHGACEHPDKPVTYWREGRFKPGLTDVFRTGLRVDNRTDDPDCLAPCSHQWSRKVFRVDVELYPKRPDGITDLRYVRSRFAVVDRFSRVNADGGTLSPRIGVVRIRKLGDPHVVRLRGQVTYLGQPVDTDRVRYSAFQIGVGDRTTTGWPIQSFAVGDNKEPGRWTTGAIFAGAHVLGITDRATGRHCRFVVDVHRVDEVLDLQLDKPRFGQRSGTCS